MFSLLIANLIFQDDADQVSDRKAWASSSSATSGFRFVAQCRSTLHQITGISYQTAGRGESESSPVDLSVNDLNMGIGEFFTPEFQFRGGKGKVKRGDLSVAMSHLLAWRSVAQGNHCLHPPSRSSDDCWVLILEDDVRLNIPDTCLLRGGGQTRIKLDPLPPDADMVLLFPSRLIKQDCSSHPSCEMFSEVSDGSGLIGYVVSRRSAKKLVRVFEVKNVVLR